jgi:hypothetical protein
MDAPTALGWISWTMTTSSSTSGSADWRCCREGTPASSSMVRSMQILCLAACEAALEAPTRAVAEHWCEPQESVSRDRRSAAWVQRGCQLVNGGVHNARTRAANSLEVRFLVEERVPEAKPPSALRRTPPPSSSNVCFRCRAASAAFCLTLWGGGLDASPPSPPSLCPTEWKPSPAYPVRWRV